MASAVVLQVYDFHFKGGTYSLTVDAIVEDEKGDAFHVTPIVTDSILAKSWRLGIADAVRIAAAAHDPPSPVTEVIFASDFAVVVVGL